jgi:hypothetical protein
MDRMDQLDQFDQYIQLILVLLDFPEDLVPPQVPDIQYQQLRWVQLPPY